MQNSNENGQSVSTFQEDQFMQWRSSSYASTAIKRKPEDKQLHGGKRSKATEPQNNLEKPALCALNEESPMEECSEQVVVNPMEGNAQILTNNNTEVLPLQTEQQIQDTLLSPINMEEQVQTGISDPIITKSQNRFARLMRKQRHSHQILDFNNDSDDEFDYDFDEEQSNDSFSSNDENYAFNDYPDDDDCDDKRVDFYGDYDDDEGRKMCEMFTTWSYSEEEEELDYD